eukprot:5263833-Amphidinium_carterae.1
MKLDPPDFPLILSRQGRMYLLPHSWSWYCEPPEIGYTLVIVDAVDTLTDAFGHTMLVMLVSAAMLPLCLLNQKYLAFTSQLAVVVNLYILGVTSFEDRDGTTPFAKPPFCSQYSQ